MYVCMINHDFNLYDIYIYIYARQVTNSTTTTTTTTVSYLPFLPSPSLSLPLSPNVALPNTPAVPATFATIVCSFSAGRNV